MTHRTLFAAGLLTMFIGQEISPVRAQQGGKTTTLPVENMPSRVASELTGQDYKSDYGASLVHQFSREDVELMRKYEADVRRTGRGKWFNTFNIRMRIVRFNFRENGTHTEEVVSTQDYVAYEGVHSLLSEASTNLSYTLLLYPDLYNDRSVRLEGTLTILSDHRKPGGTVFTGAATTAKRVFVRDRKGWLLGITNSTDLAIRQTVLQGKLPRGRSSHSAYYLEILCPVGYYEKRWLQREKLIRLERTLDALAIQSSGTRKLMFN